jgi:hypothetical protein
MWHLEFVQAYDGCTTILCLYGPLSYNLIDLLCLCLPRNWRNRFLRCRATMMNISLLPLLLMVKMLANKEDLMPKAWTEVKASHSAQDSNVGSLNKNHAFQPNTVGWKHYKMTAHEKNFSQLKFWLKMQKLCNIYEKNMWDLKFPWHCLQGRDCSLASVYWCFRGNYCFQLQGRRVS